MDFWTRIRKDSFEKWYEIIYEPGTLEAISYTGGMETGRRIGSCFYQGLAERCRRKYQYAGEGTDPGRCSRRQCPAGILRVAKESLFSELNNLMVNTILDEKDSQ